jgi:hypothetical protein
MMIRFRNRKSMRRLVALLVAPTALASAQFLYNERLDRKSQDALAGAKAVTNGETFDKELQNLDRLWKSTSARVFQTAELQMSADLSGFFDWQQVAKVVERARKNIGIARELSEAEKEQVKNLQAQLKTDQESASTALRKLKDSAASVGKNFPQIGTWLGRLGKLDALQKYARDVAGLDPSPKTEALIAELSSTFKSLADLYNNFRLALPASPQMLLLQSQLELVNAGEQHLVQLGLIRARLESDLGELQDLVNNAVITLKCVMEGTGPDCVAVPAPTNDVASTLEISVRELKGARQRFLRTRSKADDDAQLRAKQQLDTQLSLLAVAAALAARGNTALRLALLREADENQRYAIRQSSLAARSYEQILVNGAERLSLYHQGGIRPETLARLLNAAATLGLIPAVLSK